MAAISAPSFEAGRSFWFDTLEGIHESLREL
jgi:hypothetical protein